MYLLRYSKVLRGIKKMPKPFLITLKQLEEILIKHGVKLHRLLDLNKCDGRQRKSKKEKENWK